MRSESEDEADMSEEEIQERNYDKYIKENFDSIGRKIKNKKDKSIKDIQFNNPEHDQIMEQINELPDPDEHLPAPKPVLNILNFEADDAIEDMTIDQYLEQFKDFAPVKEQLGTN